MKSIFILGGSSLQVPIIKEAKERGLYTYVLDMDEECIGKEYADAFFPVSTIDYDAIYKLAKEEKPDYIITSTSDRPVSVVARLNEALGKKCGISYENSICATNKIEMRHRLFEKGVPVPKFYEVSSFEEMLSYVKKMPDKFVLKATDNAGSRGVVLVTKSENVDYKKIYDYSLSFSRNGKLLMEEYMEGDEVSVEVLVSQGEPHIVTVTDKMVTEGEFFVEIGHTEPSRHSVDEILDIKNVAISAVKAIGIENGPSHVEVKLTEDGAKIVEIAARLGGDFITSKLVPLSTGVDMVRQSLNLELGEDISYEPSKNRGSAIRFIQAEEGTVKEITGLKSAEESAGVYEISLYKSIGDKVNSLSSSSERVGHVIATGKDAKEASDNAEKALGKIQIIVD
ncbi:MAG: ATP-grasp domain-containing protein [Lachnospiraceae bacterium]|nr:ATP-grasp domain-containing protein [Lachnospiraceae bacterium]